MKYLESWGQWYLSLLADFFITLINPFRWILLEYKSDTQCWLPVYATYLQVYNHVFYNPQNSKPKTSDGQVTTPTTENSNDKPKTPAKKSISLSSMTSSMEICRICHCEAEPDQPLISPCLCAGSLQYVHQSCLQRWIKSSDTKKCELCKYEFRMESKMKPITKVSCVH